MTVDVATLGLDVDSRKLKAAERDQDSFARSAGDMERKTGKATDSIGKGFGALGKAAAMAAAAMVAAFSFGAIVNEIATFETAISKVAAVSRASATDLAKMRDIAKDLGSTTEFSAAQAADGLGFLAMAGFNAAEAIAAIPAVLDLATAAGMGLGQAADVASNIMSGFGIEATNAANVTDVLAAASSRANTSVDQLGQAMATVAPISKALGIGVEDTAAAIGVMSDAGIQGERAGTALRGVLASLAGPTSQAADALARYGLTAADVNPETHELADIMQTLAERGLSTADAMQIFGREAASGALVMVGASDRLRDFGNELRGVDGAAAEMAATMRDNLGGDIKTLQSTLSGLILALGDAGLTSVIRGVVQVLSVFIGGITSLVNGISSLANFITNNISVFVGFGQTQATTSKAIDNIVLSLADEVTAIAAVTKALPPGIELSRRAAEGKLREASAIYAKIEAARQEARQMVMSSSEYRSLGVDIDFATEALANNRNEARRTSGGEFAPIPNTYLEGIKNASDQLARARREQEALLSGAEFETEAYEEASRQIKRLEDALSSATGDVITMGESMIAVGDRGEIVFDDLGNVITATGGAASKTADELKKTAEELKKTADALNEAADPMLAYTKRLAEIERLKPHLTATAYAKAMKDANDQLANSSPLVNSLTDAWGDFVMRGFKDFQGFARGVLDTFKNMLRDMIVMAARNKIMLSMGMGGGGGMGGMLQAGTSVMGGGGGMMGGGASMLGGGAGGGGMLAGVGGMAGLGSAFMGGMGFFTSGVSAGFAAGGIGGAIGGGASAMATAASGATLGLGGLAAAAGAVALPLLAVAVVFMALQKKTKTLAKGIDVTVKGFDTAVKTFETIQTSRFFGLSKKTNTKTGTADAATADPIREAVDGIQGAIVEAADAFGFGADSFSSFSFKFRADLKGLSAEDASKKINDELTRMGDAMAGMLPHFRDMNELLEAHSQRIQLEDRLLQLQGKSAELLARQRERELKATHELNRPLLMQIHALEDQAQAAQIAAARMNAMMQSTDRFETRADQIFAATRGLTGLQGMDDDAAQADIQPVRVMQPPSEDRVVPRILQSLFNAVRDGNVNSARLLTDLKRIEERRDLEPST